MKTIVWAVDANQFSETPQKKVIELLSFLSKAGKYKILPIYIVSLLDLRIHFEIKKLNKNELRLKAEEFLSKQLELYGFPGLQPGVAIFETTNSLKGSVQTLVHFARKKKASLIVCATRAKKGLDRFLLGSFAESLVFQSSIPHLLVNPFVQGSVEIKNILFSSDFSKKSKSVWKQLIPFASGISAKIKLFHAVQEPVSYTTAQLHPLLPQAIIYVPNAMKWHYRSLQKEAAVMVEKAKRKGVAVTVQFDRSTGSVAESIEKAIMSGQFHLLAMAIEAGPISTEILGSTTRKIMRSTALPLWLARA